MPLTPRSSQDPKADRYYLQTNRPQVIVRAKQAGTEKKTAVLSLLSIPEKHMMFVGLENGDFTAVDFESGDVVFRKNFGGAVLFLVYLPDGDRVLAGVAGGTVMRVDLAAGSVAAHASLGVGADVTCAVRVGAKMVCAGTASGNLAALDLPETAPGVFTELWQRLANGFALHLHLGGGGVLSLAHAPEKKHVYAGLRNGNLVTVDLPSGKVLSSPNLAGGGVLSLAYIPEMMSVLVGMESGDLVRVDPEKGHTTGRFVTSRLSLGVGMINSLLHIPGVWSDDIVLAGIWSGDIVSVAKTVAYY
jgi:hypothetical protein